jgi:hypothetical protein
MGFSVFLGLMIVTFIAVGVNTFLPWSPYKGIIAIAVATLVMGVSLVVADRSPAISNGLLLGGLFTMAYGGVWTLMYGDSPLSFLVVTAALGVTLAFGYMKFSRSQSVD